MEQIFFSKRWMQTAIVSGYQNQFDCIKRGHRETEGNRAVIAQRLSAPPSQRNVVV